MPTNYLAAEKAAYNDNNHFAHFGVEQVENGFILRFNGRSSIHATAVELEEAVTDRLTQAFNKCKECGK